MFTQKALNAVRVHALYGLGACAAESASTLARRDSRLSRLLTALPRRLSSLRHAPSATASPAQAAVPPPKTVRRLVCQTLNMPELLQLRLVDKSFMVAASEVVAQRRSDTLLPRWMQADCRLRAAARRHDPKAKPTITWQTLLSQALRADAERSQLRHALALG